MNWSTFDKEPVSIALFSMIRLWIHQILTRACATGLAAFSFALAACTPPPPSVESETAYRNGVMAYVAHNDAEAVRWFSLAAEQGNPAGQFLLGMMYVSAEGVPQDIAEGTRLIRLSAEQGDAEAQMALGVLEFQFLPESSETAKLENARRTLECIRWIRRAADQGFAPAQNTLATIYFSMVGLDEDDDWLEELPEGLRSGFAEALPKDQAEAIRWLMTAADRGDASGLVSLGNQYRFNSNALEKSAEAIRWYKLAAEKGDPQGQVALGKMHYFGEGVRENNAEAVRWYRLAAEQGHAEGQYALAGMYRNGVGVPENAAEAAHWFQLAADQGHENAQLELAALYINGSAMPKNYVEAYKWYNLLTAEKRYDWLGPDKASLRLKMTPAQIAEAQKLSSDWKPNSRKLSQYLREDSRK